MLSLLLSEDTLSCVWWPCQLRAACTLLSPLLCSIGTFLLLLSPISHPPLASFPGHLSKLNSLSSLLSHGWVRGYQVLCWLIPPKLSSPLKVEHIPRARPFLGGLLLPSIFTTPLPMQVLIQKWVNQGIMGRHLSESQSQDINSGLSLQFIFSQLGRCKVKDKQWEGNG